VLYRVCAGCKVCAIDWETVFQCWLEIYRDGRYASEALRLLTEEVAQSGDLRARDRVTLGRLLQEIRVSARYGRSAAVERVYDILAEYEGFSVQFANLAFERVHGKR
jgi:hypothetical protein